MNDFSSNITYQNKIQGNSLVVAKNFAFKN